MNNKYNISVISLILVNLVPIIGVLFFNWSMFQIMILYWLESGIIGFFSILKILIKSRPITLGIFLTVFFCFHFGIFMLVHLKFISAINSDFELSTNSIFLIIYSAIPLFISHLISFIHNFFGKKEYLGKKEYKIETDAMTYMFEPYKRIFVMQFVIIFGAILMNLFNQPILGIVLLIILKTIVDIDAHLKSHNEKGIIGYNKKQVIN